jgi:hypothetical protein
MRFMRNGDSMIKQDGVYVLNIVNMLSILELNSDQKKDLFGILVKYPEYVNMHEPVQHGDNYAYKIEFTKAFNNEIDRWQIEEKN